MNTLAVFDFDGTLTTKDTLLQFLKYYKGVPKYYLGLAILSPILIAYKFKIIPNWKAKSLVLQYFIGGDDISEFNKHCYKYATEKLPTVMRSEAYDKLQWHKEKEHEIYVISASPENWIKPFAEKEGVFLIATQLGLKGRKLSGKFDGRNCYGPEKLNRLQQSVDLLSYNEIYVYGDSRGDREILDVATYKFYKRFN